MAGCSAGLAVRVGQAARVHQGCTARQQMGKRLGLNRVTESSERRRRRRRSRAIAAFPSVPRGEIGIAPGFQLRRAPDSFIPCFDTRTLAALRVCRAPRATTFESDAKWPRRCVPWRWTRIFQNSPCLCRSRDCCTIMLAFHALCGIQSRCEDTLGEILLAFEHMHAFIRSLTHLPICLFERFLTCSGAQ